MQSKLKKRLIITLIAVFSTALLFFIFRGPYLSNSAKRVLIPILENVTRERVLIDKAVVNVFPFYVQAKGLKVFDKDGNKLLWVTKTRAYIDLLGLLSREIRIRKLTVKEPELTVDEAALKRITENFKRVTSEDAEKTGYKISLKNIELTNGSLSFINPEGLAVSAKGLFFDMTTKNVVSAELLLKEGTVKLPDMKEVKGGLSGKFGLKKDGIDISEITVKVSKSSLQAKGELHLTPEGGLKDGRLSGRAEIYEETIHEMLGLKNQREGVVSVKGAVDMAAVEGGMPGFTVDLQTESNFYLETLMEALKVEENVTGKLSFKGEISGAFPDVTGSGAAKLEKAMFDTLPLDDATGDVKYENKKFTLSNFTAHTYKGELKGDASIVIPSGDYTVAADAAHVSSPEFFKFLEWEPPFPAGELSGSFELEQKYGQDLEVAADLNYLNTSRTEGDVFSRLHTIRCALNLKDGLLELKDTVLSTQASELFLEGDIDLNKETLALDLQLESRDVLDLTSPYYTKFIAPASFKGKAKGMLDDPEITGSLKAGPGRIHEMPFSDASAGFTYRIRALSVSRLSVNQEKASYEASGSIEFRNAKELFSFTEPYYKGKGAVKDAEVRQFIAAAYKDLPVNGTVGGPLSFEGNERDFTAKGDLAIKDSTIYGQRFDRINVKLEAHPKGIEFHSVSAQKGDSALSAKGDLSFDKRFNLTASSRKAFLSDVDMFRNYNVDGSVSLDVIGSGTLDKPDIKFSMKMSESSFRGAQTGRGEINGSLKDDALSARGSLVNGIVTFDAGASLSARELWNADIVFHKGKYNFLLTGFMKDVPEDFALSLEGSVGIKGEGRRVSMLSKLDSVSCTLYGYFLRNRNDVVLELDDGGLNIKSFSLIGDNAELTADGSVKLNKQMDVRVKGHLGLAPLKAFSEKLFAVRGQSDLNVGISGPWDSPDITGEVNVIDAAASLREYPYKVGPLNGTFFLKKDRVVFDSVRLGFGGGSAVMSGVGYLKGLSMKRAYVSAQLSGVNIRPVEKTNALVDGKLFYEMSPKGASLTGNIDVRKARYEKNIEWAKWLTGIREINTDVSRYPSFLKDTEFNISVSGSENIIIDNNIAKAPVKLNVTLTGTVSRFGLIGRLEANEGVIYFRSNEFKILEGSVVDFTDPSRITPVFHILAETYTGEYYVKLNMNGAMDKFTLSLFSDPPLNEMEILALLTFGQSRKESKGFESGIAASEAASIITGGLQDTVQEQFKSITGFERFKIEPYTTAAGAVSPRVTIGKRLLEDKLFVLYSTSIGTTEENIIKLEYKLDKNISLVGSRDEVGNTGADIKFRFEFK
ncbi:MAG: translocation/assembly module TamB domain-containing protein [Nitrospirae bacterium]|nr:translocation/assembly module TamB domain-containing protein [Nitrospirota bacterium]